MDALEEFRKIEAAAREGVHEEALTRFRQIVARDEESRMLAVEDLIFVDQDGGTYDDDVCFLSGDVRAREDEPPAPRYQIDRISPVIEQAVSDQREAQINIMVRGVGEKSSDLNDTFNGLIRNIEVVSDAADSYDNAYDECQKSGYGGWQIVTEYSDDSFEQNIYIEPIQNATQSLFFGPAKKATKEDAMYAFLIWDMDIDEFKVQYPDAERSEWPNEILTNTSRGWFNSRDNMIRVAAYWRKRPIKRTIIQLVDGRVIDQDDWDPETHDFARFPDGRPMMREVDSYQVERFILNGVEILKGPQLWAGKHIPLIPEYGIRSVINGREIIRGKVRKGKDAQRIYNYATSAIVQTAAQSAKDFYWMTAEQASGHVEDLEKMNVDQNPVYFFTPDPNNPGPPIKGTGPTVQQALLAQVAQAREDISASVGAGVGVEDGTAADNRSGQAIREGNVNREKGNSIYFNNHIRAVTYTGVQLVDLISKLWTTQRQARIIKPDGEEDFVTVNQTIVDPKTMGEIIVNDLSQGSFDVRVDVGPAYASQRQQGADQLTKLAVENPAFAEDTPDLIAKNLDVPGAKELSTRLRRRGVLNGTIEPTDEEREEFKLDLREQIKQQLLPAIREEVKNEASIRLIEAQSAQLNAEAQNLHAAVAAKESAVGETAAKTEKAISEAANIQMETLLKAIDANTKMQEQVMAKLAMGLPIQTIEKDNLDKQADLVEDAQQDINPGPSSAMVTEFEGRKRGAIPQNVDWVFEPGKGLIRASR